MLRAALLQLKRSFGDVNQNWRAFSRKCRAILQRFSDTYKSNAARRPQ